jgi:UPF0755 protein
VKFVRSVALLVLVAALLIGLAAYRTSRPYKGFTGYTFVDVPRGTSTGAMADMLVDAGVVRSRWDFLLARALNRGHVLQAGEYRFEQPASPLNIVTRIAHGDVFYYELIVPEGRNMFEIGAAAEQLGLFKAAAFVAAAENPSLVRDLDPRAPSLEGYLFPDTYKLSRHTTPDKLCRAMTAKFREAWRNLHAGAPVHDTVTLASLVEKEGKLSNERPLIAAVFSNRLRIGMKLDCDPTTIYAAILAGSYRGTIHRSDLDSSAPYNTYTHTGLPPGPIANPGIAALEAALHPADSEALYFVRRPDDSGAHEFSKSIAAHEAATDKYRRGLRQHKVR